MGAGQDRRLYSGQDLVFIIPTRDRPKKMKNLLDSLVCQSVVCGRVIIVDGGKSIEDLVSAYRDLPIEYYRCLPAGQIRQRNFGISKVDSSFRLVGFLDDDLVLERNALKEMIKCWNRVEADVAGIGFNIVNLVPVPLSYLLRFVLMNSSRPGEVLSSGFGTVIFNVMKDVRTQWLGGGYTVWKREVLLEFPQDNIDTRWAIGEDIRFSYPIGKKYPLYVCAAARVRHEHVYDQAPKRVVFRYRGRKESLARLVFVESHQELSKIACLWMLTSTAILRVAYGCAAMLPEKIEYALGQMEAIVLFLKSILGLTNLRDHLED